MGAETRSIPAKTVLLICAAALGAAACQTTPLSEPVPAIRADSGDSKTVDVLSKAASEMLYGTGITLAPNVLTTNSVLVMESKITPSMNPLETAGRINDRARPAPERFELMTDGRDCFLVRSKTGKKMLLKGVNCKPLKKLNIQPQ